jgi:hypothetical protein
MASFQFAKASEMHQNNSFIIANALKNHFTACNSSNFGTNDDNKLTFNLGDLSSFAPSHELRIQWGLLPGHFLAVTMKSPVKFKASLISADMQVIDHFALKTQIEVILEKLVTPDQSEKQIIQTIWEILVEMGFDEEVARLATVEAESNLERAIELAIPISAKMHAENLLAQHAQKNNLELGMQKYFEARLENLTSFCLLCDNVIENPNAGKSCVCSRALCAWQFKQIGLVPTSTIVTPRLVQGLPPAQQIVSLAAGERHSVACFQNGKVFSWGQGTAGQLGDGLMRTSAVAVEADSVQWFTKVDAGNDFTIALSADGGLFVWGSGSAELGLGREEETFVPKPTRIQVRHFDDRAVVFTDISVANRLCFAITTYNQVYSWGQLSEHCWSVPTLISGLYVKSVSAHNEIPVCVDRLGNIRIWSSFSHTFVPTKVEQKLPYAPQAKDYTSAAVFQNRLFASTSDGESVFEYSIRKDNGGWILVHCSEYFGVQRYTTGPTFGVFSQNGVVRVAGTGTEVMCSDEIVTSTSGVEIPQIRFAHYLAAGPHHVVCVAMSDRIVYGQSPEDEARNVFVYQWGRDHTVNVAVECEADVKKNNELKWARLADQALVISAEQQRLGVKPGCEPLSEDMLPERSFDDDLEYTSEDLEEWNQRFHDAKVKLNNDNTEDEMQEVVQEDEDKDRQVALEILNKCYEMRDVLNVKLETDQSQLVIDLNHPALLVGKISDENSSLKNVNIDVNAKDHNGNTALMLAMKDNDYDLFSRLVDLGSDLDAMNNQFEFPLDMALTCGTSYAKSFVVLLVDKGASKFSPLHHDLILNIVAAAAEYFPKLATRVEALKLR